MTEKVLAEIRQQRQSRNPGYSWQQRQHWIPACAGMTEKALTETRQQRQSRISRYSWQQRYSRNPRYSCQQCHSRERGNPDRLK